VEQSCDRSPIHSTHHGPSGPAVGRWCETLGPRKVIWVGSVDRSWGVLLGSRTGDLSLPAVWRLRGNRRHDGFVPITVLVSRWFVDNRGLALGVATSGPQARSSSSRPFPIAQLGWRQAYLPLGRALGCPLGLFGDRARYSGEI
jgi:hypothetical protein